ncbi:hypothetical protein N7493_000927 [Penicillium malachiteum]|uniref:Uncharacterized protein n=1 Tax=Penicillium malachiteum TaxID=1324776 RepID=A0AAD6N1W0_9EURO|nr:hypothetical protein N7493_000927 [Penicillium malachiteum]
MSDQNQTTPDEPEERINAARGYKAALHNKKVSMEAKEHAQEMLPKLNEEGARQELREKSSHMPYHRHQRYGQRSRRDEIPISPQGRIDAARGYKAATRNPLVSAEGRTHARNMLQQIDDEEARQELYHQDDSPKDPMRVAAGLKAARKNPLVSEKGHKWATEQLHEFESDN